jgi:4-amino-4-deoxy-L-arabinose transferase-like glycosyltransferase
MDGEAGARVRLPAATAIRPALWAAAAQLVLLTLGSVGYGFHRDELYFRMLPPAWGYVDQPPLVPWLARTLTSLVADEAWALRIPATLASAASVVLVGLVTHELGGDRRAVAFAAWGVAFAGLPLALGHLLLTSTLDLPMTLGVLLCVLLALRTTPRWWLVAGAVAGVATWNRLLVPLVWFGVLLGLAVLGPRAPLRTRWPWLGAAVAAVVGAPNLVFQWSHDWPQLAMGRALADSNAGDVRADLPLILLIAIGPPLVVVWLAGAWEAWRLPRARWLLAPAAVLLVFTVVTGAQPHYPLVMLVVLYAVGCLPLSRWVGEHAWRRVVVVALIGLNALVSAVVALPVVPVSALGATPLPDLSILVADQVGWPRYVAQVGAVAARAGDPAAVVITSNYGEAGAIARYGPALGLPAPYSGQNDLGTRDGPPEGTRTVVFVGWQLDEVAGLFDACSVLARLDDGVGVDNEEQGAPVAVCTDPKLSWAQLWPKLAHLD